MYSLHARTTSTAPRSFSHDQHHKTDAAKGKGGLNQVEGLYQECYSGLAATSGSDSIINIVRARRLGLFGHVARFSRDVPASNILSICCASGDGYPPDPSWRRLSGRSRTTWLEPHLFRHWHVFDRNPVT